MNGNIDVYLRIIFIYDGKFEIENSAANLLVLPCACKFVSSIVDVSKNTRIDALGSAQSLFGPGHSGHVGHLGHSWRLERLSSLGVMRDA